MCHAADAYTPLRTRIVPTLQSAHVHTGVVRGIANIATKRADQALA
jgi:hypothetical protein